MLRKALLVWHSGWRVAIKTYTTRRQLEGFHHRFTTVNRLCFSFTSSCNSQMLNSNGCITSVNNNALIYYSTAKNCSIKLKDL